MKKFIFLSLVGLFAPVFARAQTAPNFNYVDRFVTKGTSWLNLTVTILMVVMTIIFLVAVVNFIREKEPANVPDRKRQVLRGLVGLFVAVGVWGILRIAGSVFGVDTSGNTPPPGVTCPPGFRWSNAQKQCI